MRGTRLFEGWPIVGWLALAVALVVAAILLRYGTSEEGVRMVLRATARTSLALFLAAFLASSARRLAATRLTAWMLRNRRQLGVSFAVSHVAHGWAIVELLRVTGRRPDPVTLAAGGMGYLVLAAMTATSFDRTAAWLGSRAWHRLHGIGILYLWLVFTLTYLGSAVRDPLAAASLGLLLVALGVRLASGRRVPRKGP